MKAIHRDLVPNLQARQYTLTVRDSRAGALLAVIPLVLQKSVGLTLAQPADFGVCDYNTIVGDPATLERLAADPSVTRRINALLAPADALMFRKLPDQSFQVSRLFGAMTSTPCENAAYYSETGEDFEEWQRRTLRRKFSKELSRLARQFEREHGTYTHRPASNEAEIRQAFEALRTFRNGRFESDLLDSDVYFNFYLDYAIAARESGEAITYVSYLDGQPVAVLFGLSSGNQFHAVLIGADTEHYGKFSLGTQIIFRTIKARFDQGHRRFDMGLGNTGYKSQFRVEQSLLRNYTSSRSLTGSVVTFVYHHAKPLKDRLRRYVPHVR